MAVDVDVVVSEAARAHRRAMAQKAAELKFQVTIFETESYVFRIIV